MNITNDVERAILARRAQRLARPLAEPEATDSVHQSPHLVIRIGDERLGIPLEHVIEVHRFASLTPIPGARPPVVGVVAWRGRVLTVLDIATRRASVPITQASRILVLGQQRAVLGIIADEVDDVHTADQHGLEGLDDVAPAAREFVRGATSDAVVLIDVAALLARFSTTP